MLLDRFQFIQPKNNSGFEPSNRSIPFAKKHQYRYVNRGTIIGDAPKCMIELYEFEKGGKTRKSNPSTWKNYIAKSASKYYPNESITEHLLNELGKTLGQTMANSKLYRFNNQIWFLSEYFLKEEMTLYHGADLFGDYISDKKLIDEVQNNNKINDQEFFTVQLVREALTNAFPKDAEVIFEEFINMLILDGILGINDRHSYNWG